MDQHRHALNSISLSFWLSSRRDIASGTILAGLIYRQILDGSFSIVHRGWSRSRMLGFIYSQNSKNFVRVARDFAQGGREERDERWRRRERRKNLLIENLDYTLPLRNRVYSPSLPLCVAIRNDHECYHLSETHDVHIEKYILYTNNNYYSFQIFRKFIYPQIY